MNGDENLSGNLSGRPMTPNPEELAGRPVWDEAPWRSFPALTGDVDADVCVVGLGGSGLTCIGALLDRGLLVIGIDGGVVAGGAAGRNGGFLTAGAAGFYHRAVESLGQARASALYALTLREVDRINAETPEAVRGIGVLRIALTPEEDADCLAHLDALQADGFPAQRYEGPEGTGLLLPADGSFQPLLRCRLLARRVTDRGATLYESTPALDLTGTQVTTPGGKVRCGFVIVAVDGHLERVLPELAPRVRTARLQMLATAPGPPRFPRPVCARYSWEYWQQLADGRVALGGFRDLGGDREWTSDIRPTDEIQQALERFLRTHLRVQAPVTHCWAAAASWNPTRLPIMEQVRPGVWAIGSYSGSGNVMGAICGRAVAELAVTGRSEVADLLRS